MKTSKKLLVSMVCMAMFSVCTAKESKMVSLNEDELSSVNAQGLHEDLLDIVKNKDKQEGYKVLGTVYRVVFNPLLGFLSADTTIGGVVYGENRSPIMNANGYMTLPMPISIAEIRIDNIRPVAAGGVGGPSMGSILIKDIQFNNTKIQLVLR